MPTSSISTSSVTIIPVLLAALATPASAAPALSDLGFAVADQNHDKTTGMVVDKLFTFELPPKCLAKVIDKGAVLSSIASMARTVERYAKTLTDDDWTKIEAQSANTKEQNLAIVEKMVDEFKPKLHVTVKYDGGDDCDVKLHALWAHYTADALYALDKYPPKAGKLTITVTATGKVKVHSCTVDKTGTALTVTGPRDIEPTKPWADDCEKALSRVSSKS